MREWGWDKKIKANCNAESDNCDENARVTAPCNAIARTPDYPTAATAPLPLPLPVPLPLPPPLPLPLPLYSTPRLHLCSYLNSALTSISVLLYSVLVTSSSVVYEKLVVLGHPTPGIESRVSRTEHRIRQRRSHRAFDCEPTE